MKILFISLGCDKNLADSEEMLGLLTAGGHEITDDETKADAIVINTCCFIKDAKEESVETILEMAEYKKSGVCQVLIVTGCMAQRYQKEIIEEVPEVDAVLGTTSYGDIVKALEEATAGNHFEEYRDIDYLPDTGSKRVLTTGALYLLYYPEASRKIPKCSHGASDRPGRGYGRAGCEGADPGSPGDHRLW